MTTPSLVRLIKLRGARWVNIWAKYEKAGVFLFQEKSNFTINILAPKVWYTTVSSFLSFALKKNIISDTQREKNNRIFPSDHEEITQYWRGINPRLILKSGTSELMQQKNF